MSAIGWSFSGKKTGGESLRRPFLFSDSLKVSCLGSARIRLDVERDLLAFAEAAQAGLFDGCGVNEHVLASAFRRDESEAFGAVEELYCADGHLFSFQTSGFRERAKCRSRTREKRDHQFEGFRLGSARNEAGRINGKRFV
jgi:hypothetical protein